MAEDAATRTPFAEDQDHQLWLRYLEVAGDRAMSVRLEAMRKVARAGRAVAARTDGPPTTAPLMVAAEANAAALEGCDERRWREDWVKRLVCLAVTWQEEPTTAGVVCVLTLTDRLIRDLKAVDAWPWPAEADGPAPAPAPGPCLDYVVKEVPCAGIQAVQGPDYVVWHRLLETSGDGPVATRLAAIHAASQSNCSMTVATADGRRLSFPTMIVAEGAIAAHKGKSEARWREEWTRRCVRIVTRWPDPQTIDAVAALLYCTPSVVAELKYARVWPWLGARKADQSIPRRRAEPRPAAPLA